MGKISKFNSFFLAIAVFTVTLGQVLTSPVELPIYTHTQDSDTPAYSGLSNPFLWELVDLESNASLLNLLSSNSSEEDSRVTTDADKARESSLENFTTLYLLIARDIDVTPTTGELLYPFHFFF